MSAPVAEYFDVLIVGAGLSGVGAAAHLQNECPTKTFAIVEARAASGGTWDLFRYPGIRSDSDMYTMAYAFKPWTNEQSFGDGDSIRNYIRDTARDRGIDDKIRYHSRVRRAAWSSAEARWTVEIERADTGITEYLACGFLFGNTGYYRYDAGYTPEFAGRDSFGGRIVHPQHWPEDLDCTDKKVVVIGSGATAVTLVPALADQVGHVTMVQRSPSYIASLPNTDPIGAVLRRRLSAKNAGRALRIKNMLFAWLIFQVSRHAPQFMKSLLLKGVAAQLPDDYDIGTHFTPRYLPWDQRLCFAPEGDLFTAIREGKASVVTGQIDSFVPSGLRLQSGEVLEADVIVTATGLTMQMLGGMALEVDGRPIDVGRAVTYKSLMLCGVPNLAFIFGYTNSSWTLKSDLADRYVCRLLNYMDAHGYAACTPVEPDAALPTAPYLDLTAGYVQRAAGLFPLQGAEAPWRVRHNYPVDYLMYRYGHVDDGVAFSRRVPDRAVNPSVAV